MSYLKSKAGSVEETITKMSSKVVESDYQDKFKKELDKAGKGIGSMTPAEKKAFFNKIDSMHKAKDEQAKNPYAIGMAQAMKSTGDTPPLKKSTIVKGHEIAKSIEKDMKKEEVEEVKEASVREGGPGSGPQGNGAKKTNFSSAQIKQAYGILNDPRYKQGNYSGAVKTINKVSPGLADHPDVLKALKRANEEKELEETHMSMKKAQNQSQLDAKGEKEIVKPISMKETIVQMWKEASEKKEQEQNKNKKTTMTGEKPSEVDLKPQIKYSV